MRQGNKTQSQERFLVALTPVSCSRLGTALAECLVKQDAGRDGRVERADLALQGNRHLVVAFAAHELREARPLGSDDQGDVT